MRANNTTAGKIRIKSCSTRHDTSNNKHNTNSISYNGYKECFIIRNIQGALSLKYRHVKIEYCKYIARETLAML